MAINQLSRSRPKSQRTVADQYGRSHWDKGAIKRQTKAGNRKIALRVQP